MLSIAHATTGAVLATSLPASVAVPVILASHYVFDAIAHYDAGTGLSSGKKTRKTALILGIIDLILAIVTIFLFYPTLVSTLFMQPIHFFSLPQVWGGLLGLLPDFLEAPRNFLKYEPAWLKPINKFHNLFHHSTPNILAGLAPQVILLTLLWIFR